MTAGTAWNLFVVVVPAWVLLPVGGVVAILCSARRPKDAEAVGA